MKITKNEKIIATAIIIIVIAMIWMGVNLANMKELLNWWVVG